MICLIGWRLLAKASFQDGKKDNGNINGSYLNSNILEKILPDYNIINDSQCGFRAKTSTCHALAIADTTNYI